MKSASTAPRRKVGRPLEFDRQTALEKAMLLFWRHGFEATSISDLTAAMGITPPSLYSAFGDKKRLFLEAVQRYVSDPVTAEQISARIIDHAPTARDAALGLMTAAATGFTGTDTPSGCLLATAATSCSTEAADVQAALANIRLGVEERLREKICRSVAAGEMTAGTDPGALAVLVMAVIQGMSTLARDGATREKLLTTVGVAMRAWPD